MPCFASGSGGIPAAGSSLASEKKIVTGMTQKVDSPSPQAAGNTHLHLPRLRVLRRGHGSSNLGTPPIQTPRTPRRRHGRLGAGAAILYFTSPSRKSYSISRSVSTPDLSHTTPALTRGVGFCKYGVLPSSSATMLDSARQHQCRAPSASAGSEGAGPISSEALAEKSTMVQEEVLLYFYLLDLKTRLQRSLNQEDTDTAQTFKLQISQVEQEIKKQLAKRTGQSGEELSDGTVAVISLRADLLRAIEEERFADAAAIRDKLSKLEVDKQVKSQSMVPENVNFRFRLGQRIRHKVFGYRGCIFGIDPTCYESEAWMVEAKVDALERGRMQPFYQILVDTRDKLGFLVAYVAEENIILPSKPEESPLEHPYTYMLFYGADAAGDLIPSKQLREKFNAPRYEIPSSEGDQKDQ